MCVCVCVCVYHIKEKPLKVTHIFCNSIYFSGSYTLKILDLDLRTKK